MSRTLTCWKEIAQYMGKGVRTVQRWEQEMGLPVRRPKGRSKGVVFALTEDIDDWLREQSKQRSDNHKQELESLRNALSEVMAQNQMLSTTIIRLQQTKLQGKLPERAAFELERAAQVMRDYRRASQVLAETIEMSKNLKMIRNGLKGTASTIDKSPFRT